MQHQALLENYLRQLRLPTFAQNYQAFAQDAARTNLSFERYLLALCQAEAEQRQANRLERAIINAKFPIVKELASFDFSLVQGITKTRVLELSQGGYLSRAENNFPALAVASLAKGGEARKTNYPPFHNLFSSKDGASLYNPKDEKIQVLGSEIDQNELSHPFHFPLARVLRGVR